MNNFICFCPTKVLFGKGQIASLPEVLPKNKKILMIYGGGSIKRNGVYEQTVKALKGFDFLEFGGIEPNPAYETAMKAVEMIKKEKIEFLLPVGGGSTLDATKFIAAAALYEGEDPYDMTKGAPVKAALPFGDIITLPATGSEMNCGAVISRKSTREKLVINSPLLFPVFSIIDPQVTYSLPERQTINGAVDTFVHTMEQYCTYDVNTPLQDEWAFGILKTLISETPKVLKNPKDYEARANMFWAATCGLNSWINMGCVQDWATHMIGHETTAFYGLDHARTLATIMPRLLKNRKADKLHKLAKLSREVFGFSGKDDSAAADYAIDHIELFFNSIGMKTHFSDYGIDAEECAGKIRDRFASRGTVLGEKGNITPETVYEILKSCK